MARQFSEDVDVYQLSKYLLCDLNTNQITLTEPLQNRVYRFIPATMKEILEIMGATNQWDVIDETLDWMIMDVVPESKFYH